MDDRILLCDHLQKDWTCDQVEYRRYNHKLNLTCGKDGRCDLPRRKLCDNYLPESTTREIKGRR